MNPLYAIADTSTIFSPALVFYKDLIRRNIAHAVEMAGEPDRLRPHVKTHKTREIVRMELDAGITKHKCATLAEAEMLAGCGVPDVLLAYHLVGPNCGRLARLVADVSRLPLLRHWPTIPPAVEALSAAHGRGGPDASTCCSTSTSASTAPASPPAPEAVALYELIARLPGLRPAACTSTTATTIRRASPNAQAAVQSAAGAGAGAARRRWRRRGCRCRAWSLGGTPTFPGLRHGSTCPAWNARRAPASCTITATARASPT